MTDLKVDEAKGIIGREIFRDAWVAELTKGEWDLAQLYKKALAAFVPLPSDPAAEQAHAKLKRAERQGSEVGTWFENRGFDTTKEYLDLPRFEAAFVNAFGEATFAKAFGRPLTDKAMSTRDRAVLRLLLAGKRPGKNEFWEIFIRNVKSEMGAAGEKSDGLSKRQLDRVVTRLMKIHKLD